MKILFLVPYSLGESPSQRFRFEQYLNLLSDQGFSYKVLPFFKSQRWRIFYKKGDIIAKIGALFVGFIGRIKILCKVRSYDFVFIHREATPVGPPFAEWTLANIFRKKIIYDFDDAIWLTDKKNENGLEKFLRSRGKVARIIKWSHKISCGNQYLASYSSAFSRSVILNPTTIDLERVHRTNIGKKSISQKIIIGWTGSHSTLKYLKEIEDVLSKLEKKYSEIEIWVIADERPKLNLQRFSFKKWTLETEISDLAQFDIGLMPLPEDNWTKGKCGFKALQYMAMKIPPVASPVGVNSEIIQHGENGFLANNEQEWVYHLSLLIEDMHIRKRLGEAALKTVKDCYSVESNSKNFLSLFD